MKSGFIKLIVVVALVIVILSLLGISLSNVVENPTVRDNFKFVLRGVKWLWDMYLIYPAQFMWNLLRNFFVS